MAMQEKKTPEAEQDEAQVEFLQRSAFNYFLEHSNEKGLVADTSRPGAPCSIAVVGFALSCYPIGVARGWMSRTAAAEKTLATLRFFTGSRQSPETDATGYKGFYYHFLDMQSGKRVWDCELSLIDTGLLLAGILAAATYFDGASAEEDEIRALADELYRRMDWVWAQGGNQTISQGWLPNSGFLHYGWEGYSEAIILYALAMGSPTFPLPESGYKGWRDTYQWEDIYGHAHLYAGPLFIHLFSHAWIDFRGIRDSFFAGKDSDYFENTRRVIYIQRRYAQRNPLGFKGYDADLWGLSACDGPQRPPVMIDGRKQFFFGYAARGVPYGPDDGTLVPWASLACLPFTPDMAMRCLKKTLEQYPGLLRQGQFPGSYNPSLAGTGPEGWVSDGISGLDQGLIVMMIENHRSGMIWDLMKKCLPVREGLRKAGFTEAWLA